MKTLKKFFYKFDDVVMTIIPYLFETLLVLVGTAGVIWSIKTILKLLGVL